MERFVTDERPSVLDRSRKERLGTELLCDYLFRPLAHLVVVLLLPLRVPPPAVVLASTAAGLSAAVAIAHGNLVAGALLVQLKTVLDNADGQLARASGRVSALGRYLDSESDLLVNAALFAGVGFLTGEPWLALAGFVALTLVLSVDFNLERLYRRERGEVDEVPPAHGGAAIFASMYRIVYGPHDRLIERFVERRLGRIGGDLPAREAYHDRWTLGVLATVGLSTQLAVLGLCLVLGRPGAYAWFTVACAVALVPLALRRELRARRTGRPTAQRTESVYAET
jgi:archaetidylinositol phosphate synthase